MKTEILISCDEWENRVAVLEEDSLAEIYFEREEKVIGSIYKGRVENVLPGMGACFVNIGLGRNAFLYVDDIMRDPINIGETEITDRRKGHTVNELLKVGSDVLVQIVKEPRGLKGARVSTNVSLPGRYLVLMPTGRYSGVSSKIEDANERARLKQILRRVRPEGMATIVRTAAQGVSEAELIADLGVQLRLWHGILESYKRSSAPALVHKDLNLVFKAVRDFMTSDVSAVYIDSKEQYEAIRSTMSLLGPQYIDRLKLVEGASNLFEARGIDEELQKLLKPKIPLPSGGHLVLEHTEALTVIDVNTGKFTGGRNLEDTIVRTNLEAAAEVARQVRLRDIGGIIVVDFIDMARERSREQVIQTLTASLRRDRTRSTIQAFSNLGLLEFTRKRVGKDLAGQLRSECPYCIGLGTVMSSETLAIGVLRQLRGISSNGHRVQKLDVVCDASVATQLVGWYRDELTKLVKDHNIEVGLFVDPLRHREHVIVEESRRLRPAPQPGTVVEAELLQVRMPNPASGVAVINGYLVEVKDAANGAGQTVKIKIDAVETNYVLAELAEALPVGQRRRRRERGRGRIAGEAPIAPPVPTLVSSERQPDRGDEPRRALPGRQGRVRPLAPAVADDGEEEAAYREPAARAPARGTGRGRAEEPTERAEGPARRRRGGGGGPRSRGGSQYPPPLVVGGDGDIDYEDDEDEAAAPAAARPRTETAEDAEAGARRRRRRRGRGKGRAAEPIGSSGVIRDEDEDRDEDDDAIVVPARRAAPLPERRPATPTGRYARSASDDDDEQDAERGGDQRRSPAPPRSEKRYGQVRQIYGRPAAREKETARPPYDRPAPRTPAPKPYVDDDLDVVIKPKAPAAIRVDVRTDMPRRAGGHDRPRQRIDEPRDREDRGFRDRDRDRDDGPPRVERPPRDDRPPREDRAPRGERALRDDRPRRPDRPLRDDDLVSDGPPPMRNDRPPLRDDRPPRGDRPRRDDRPPRDAEPMPGRTPRDPGEDRGDRGGRPGRGGPRGGGRGGPRAPRAPRAPGPAVKQVYPPPDQAAEPQEDRPVGGGSPLRNIRASRGPLMRPTDAPPVPKGKVRQLYPPPPFDASAPEVELDADSDEAVRLPQTAERASSSLFVDDAEELEERRLRARERAEARRRTDLEPEGDVPPAQRPETKPVDDLPGGDEWPAF